MLWCSLWEGQKAPRVGLRLEVKPPQQSWSRASSPHFVDLLPQQVPDLTFPAAPPPADSWLAAMVPRSRWVTRDQVSQCEY